MAINQVTQSNAPKALSMDQFKSAADRGGSFSRGCRFIVAISPPQALRSRYPSDMHYMCEAAELPGRGFAVAEARYYGPSQLMPTNPQYQPLSVTLLSRSDCRERRFFDDWLDYINPISNFRFRYPNEYYCMINIYQYPEYGIGDFRKPMPTVSYNWCLHKAWPTLVNPQPVNWAEQDILRLQVSFAYKYWDRPNLIGGTGDNTGNAGTQSQSQQNVQASNQFDVSFNPTA